MGAMAHSLGHSQAGNSDCLAAKGVSTLLDFEEQDREERPTKRQQGSAGVDPKDEQGESNLGSTAAAWRVAETGN
jgi:hypothetical protein